VGGCLRNDKGASTMTKEQQLSARRTIFDVPVDNAQQLPVIEASGERGSW